MAYPALRSKLRSMLTPKNAAELVSRVRDHVESRVASRDVRLIWFGYATALLEWGMLSPSDYKLILDLCEPIDDVLANELLLGLPGHSE